MILNISDFETWEIVSRVCAKFAADVDTTQDEFFNNILAAYDGEPNADALELWLDKELSNQFKTFGERPNWIQGAEWPYHEGVPMIFVGQILIDDPPETLLHDGTQFYLFVPQGRWCDADVRVISQQY